MSRPNGLARRHGAVLLLLGGAKSSQARDIERARRMLAELDEG
jgi:putative component of toxin-antitoxin plasmid stabilization module